MLFVRCRTVVLFSLAFVSPGQVGLAQKANGPVVVAPVQAISADTLVDSAGVNVHLNYLDTAYGSFDDVKRALLTLGVRHVRDGLSSTKRQGYYAEHNELGLLGIKSIFTTSVGQTPALWLSYPKLMNQCFEGYEGPNEYDNHRPVPPEWASSLTEELKLLSETVRGEPGNFPVFGPSIVHSESYPKLGDVSRYFDYGNMHSYAGGMNPGTAGRGDKDAQGYLHDSIPWHKNRLHIIAPGLPFVSTEVGYTDQMSLSVGVPESVAAIYIPRLILEQWIRGASRTYIYELVSSGHEDFGLIRSDWTPKPAFGAMANLLKLLADPGPAYKSGGLAYGLSGANADLHQLLMQKRDGTFYLALWLEESAYDLKAKKLTLVFPQTVKLKLPEGSKVVRYQWDDKGGVSISDAGDHVPLAISVSDRLLILKITK